MADAQNQVGAKAGFPALWDKSVPGVFVPIEKITDADVLIFRRLAAAGLLVFLL